MVAWISDTIASAGAGELVGAVATEAVADGGWSVAAVVAHGACQRTA
jgi:hypothetical protein